MRYIAGKLSLYLFTSESCTFHTLASFTRSITSRGSESEAKDGPQDRFFDVRVGQTKKL